MDRLNDKIAIVTGASSGIGREIARLFVAEGATVVGVARRTERLAELEKELNADGTERFVGCTADICDDIQCDHAFQTTMERFGRVDILVNTAGITDDCKGLHEVEPEVIMNVLRVNVVGTMMMCKKALKIMMEQKSGNIINFGSISSLVSGRVGAVYTASKHAVLGLTKNIGYQYHDYGIRCNAILPGNFETEMNCPESWKKTSKWGLSINSRGGQVCTILDKPERIAKCALFLASDDSDTMSGTYLLADNGWLAF